MWVAKCDTGRVARAREPHGPAGPGRCPSNQITPFFPMAGKKTQDLLAMAKNPANLGVRLMHALATQLPPEKVAKKIVELMDATTTVRTGMDSMKTVPDYRTQLAAVQLYMSYQLGMPVQRVVTEMKVEEAAENTMARLLSSPAMREALKRELKTVDV